MNSKKGQKAKLRERYFKETGIYPLDNLKRYSHWLEDEIVNNINYTHSCETLKDKYTMPFDVWYDKNVVESKDGKYFVDGERLRFYELISKHKTECLLDL